MDILNTPDLPKANGHYSQCIKHNGLLYLSGQLPIHPQTKEIPASIQEQTQLTLDNVEAILKEAGVTRDDIIQVRIYLAGIELWDEVNMHYSIFFGNHKPARSIIPVGKLHFGCLIEVEVVAQAK